MKYYAVSFCMTYGEKKYIELDGLYSYEDAIIRGEEMLEEMDLDGDVVRCVDEVYESRL